MMNWQSPQAFEVAPFTLAWEITRACALRCVHCRAEAQPRRHPAELTTEEGFRLIDDAAAMGTQVLVITGGDPFMRPDVASFIAHGKAAGLRVALSPSATRLVTHDALATALQAGLDIFHLSLDGATPIVHRPSDATAPAGANDGKGFCFVDHLGNVCPSGFLQLPAGNVRQQPLATIYRDSPLFRALRDPSRLKGKCGRCEFREVCGRSRARTWAITGDPLAADPTCPYEPSANPSASEQGPTDR